LKNNKAQESAAPLKLYQSKKHEIGKINLIAFQILGQFSYDYFSIYVILRNYDVHYLKILQNLEKQQQGTRERNAIKIASI